MRQIYHGTRYIDEVVAERLEHGLAFVHQDANWNVIALTDFAGKVLEHNHYTPYGIVTVDQETYFGDYDGMGLVVESHWDTDSDGQLDSDDDCWGSGPSGVCRLVDFDFDGDVDAADATRLDELDSTTTYRQPGQSFSGIGNTRAHQGLIYDAELGSYNNRRRQYAPKLKRYKQRDPLTLSTRASSGYPDGLGLYHYAGSSPVGRLDPRGLKLKSAPGKCGELLSFLGRVIPPGRGHPGWYCCGDEARVYEGPTQHPCSLCDLIDSAIIASETYTIRFGSAFIAAGWEGSKIIWFDDGDVSQFPPPPLPAYPQATTEGEIVAHEIAEMICAVAEGEGCHAGAATDAQNGHRGDLGLQPLVRPVFPGPGQKAVFDYGNWYTEFPPPDGPPSHHNEPYPD